MVDVLAWTFVQHLFFCRIYISYVVGQWPECWVSVCFGCFHVPFVAGIGFFCLCVLLSQWKVFLLCFRQKSCAMAIVGAAENPRDIVCGVAEEPLVEGGCRFHYCHLVLVLAGVSMSVTWSILMTILWSRLTKLQIARSMSPRNVCAVCHPLCASRQKSFRCLFVRQLTMSMRSAIFVYS